MEVIVPTGVPSGVLTAVGTGVLTAVGTGVGPLVNTSVPVPVSVPANNGSTSRSLYESFTTIISVGVAVGILLIAVVGVACCFWLKGRNSVGVDAGISGSGKGGAMQGATGATGTLDTTG